jgi:hypothetical protein
LQALEQLDRGRRALIAAIASGQEPSPESLAQLRAGRQSLDAVGERARGLVEGRPPAREQGQGQQGNLRITVLGLNRPYLDRGPPLDPGWEYVSVRLRLENVGGEPVRYDAFQFRLRAADDTVHSTVPLSAPDELLYGALEGNRLASQIVGHVVFAVRKGVASSHLLYERQAGDVALQIPVGDLAPVAAAERPAATATRAAAATPVPNGGAAPAPTSATVAPTSAENSSPPATPAPNAAPAP